MRRRNAIGVDTVVPSNAEAVARVRQQINAVHQDNEAARSTRSPELPSRIDGVSGGSAQWLQVCGSTRWLEQQLVEIAKAVGARRCSIRSRGASGESYSHAHSPSGSGSGHSSSRSPGIPSGGNVDSSKARSIAHGHVFRSFSQFLLRSPGAFSRVRPRRKRSVGYGVDGSRETAQ